ncbi:MAG: hypothetical protein FVQ80_04080 [Planctomycetes bacterium]|nr:hypothetical protein [Planctomycetota bacterium]
MNPEIRKYWEAALKAFNTAKTAFKNGESDSEVKRELCIAVVYGYLAIRTFSKSEGGISADTFRTWLEEIDNLGSKHAIDITLKALKEYHNLVPKEYNLPVPVNC